MNRLVSILLVGVKKKKILKTSLSLLILLVLSFVSFSSGGKENVVLASAIGTLYGPELRISGDWIIDNKTVEITSEQPIYFPQDYHEQYKIVVQNGGVLKISNSYIRSDFRFLLVLHDTSKLFLENSNLLFQKSPDGSAVITNLDNSVVEAKNSQLDFVGIANGNGPISYLTIDLENCGINQLELDLFDMKNVVIDGLITGNIEDRTFSSEKFSMTLKNCAVEGEVVSRIENAEVTFKNCKMGQISPDERSFVNIENCTMREIEPRVTGYSGVISGLPQGNVSSFQLNLPATNGPSINIINSIIENGWRFRYFSGCNIEFRNCYFSVLQPSWNNYASVYDSIVKEVWIWSTSGEIHFENSPIGWIGKIMSPNDILLSGDITVKDKNWESNYWVNNWGDTIIRREFFFSFPFGSGDCIIENEEGTIVDQFIVGILPIKKVLSFDKEKRNFKVYLNGILMKTLELSSDSDVVFPNTYNIQASAGIGGSIFPSGIVTINYGNSKTFNIIPDNGYKIANVKVDGVSKGSLSSFSFTNVTADHTVTATFEKEVTETVIILQIGNTTFTVNGVSNTLDSPPVIKNSRTLLPIRAIIESLGGTVGWDATARKVTVSLGLTTIELWIGKSIAKVNGIDTPIDSTNSKVVPEIINSRTMLPLRFVTENLGCDVQWDGTTKTITIMYPKP
jgi:hypothetical protein